MMEEMQEPSGLHKELDNVAPEERFLRENKLLFSVEETWRGNGTR